MPVKVDKFFVNVSGLEVMQLMDRSPGARGLVAALEAYFVQRVKYAAAGQRRRIVNIRKFRSDNDPTEDFMRLSADVYFEDADRIEGVDEMLKDQAYSYPYAVSRPYTMGAIVGATIASDTGPIYVTAAPTRRKPRRPAEPSKEQPRTVQLDLDEAPAHDIAAAPVAGRQLDLD